MPVFLEWYGNPVIVSLLFPYHTPIIFKRYGILSKACQHFPYQMPEFFSWYGNHVKASMLFPYHTLVFFEWYGIHGKACHRFPYHTPIFFNRYGIHVKTGQQLYISLSPKTLPHSQIISRVTSLQSRSFLTAWNIVKSDLIR